MESLNLPTFSYRIRRTKEKDYIFDLCRKKYVRLTPEEWVRQHMIHYLVRDLNYPISLIKLELPIEYGRLCKRIDMLVSGRGDASPLMLIECKASNQKIYQTHFAQVAAYNLILRAPFITVSNGVQHFCFKIDIKNGTYSLLKKIPFFEDLVDHTAHASAK